MHGGQHALPAAGRDPLIERGDDAEREMQTGARIADLRARHKRRTIVEPGRRGRAARALRDVFVDLAVLVGPGAESLDRGVNHARINLLYFLPGKTHAIDGAGGEVLDHDVAHLDQLCEDPFACWSFGIQRDAALVRIQHRKIKAVDCGNVAQLAARGVAFTRPLDLDDIGAQPCQQLSACGSRLHVGHIQDPDSFQRFFHDDLP